MAANWRSVMLREGDFRIFPQNSPLFGVVEVGESGAMSGNVRFCPVLSAFEREPSDGAFGLTEDEDMGPSGLEQWIS